MTHWPVVLRRIPWMTYERPWAPRSIALRWRSLSVHTDGWNSRVIRGISRYGTWVASQPSLKNLLFVIVISWHKPEKSTVARLSLTRVVEMSRSTRTRAILGWK
jgi:hypothetical protein